MKLNQYQNTFIVLYICLSKLWNETICQEYFINSYTDYTIIFCIKLSSSTAAILVLLRIDR